MPKVPPVDPDDIPPSPRGTSRRKDSDHYRKNGYFIQGWDQNGWHVLRYYRDLDGMRRAFDAMLGSYFPKYDPIRMRWPGDGKDNTPPLSAYYRNRDDRARASSGSPDDEPES